MSGIISMAHTGVSKIPESKYRHDGVPLAVRPEAQKTLSRHRALDIGSDSHSICLGTVPRC